MAFLLTHVVDRRSPLTWTGFGTFWVGIAALNFSLSGTHLLGYLYLAGGALTFGIAALSFARRSSGKRS